MFTFHDFILKKGITRLIRLSLHKGYQQSVTFILKFSFVGYAKIVRAGVKRKSTKGVESYKKKKIKRKRGREKMTASVGVTRLLIRGVYDTRVIPKRCRDVPCATVRGPRRGSSRNNRDISSRWLLIRRDNAWGPSLRLCVAGKLRARACAD